MNHSNSIVKEAAQGDLMTRSTSVLTLLSECPSVVRLSILLFVRMSVPPYVCLSVCPSVFPSICLSECVCPSVCASFVGHSFCQTNLTFRILVLYRSSYCIAWKIWPVILFKHIEKHSIRWLKKLKFNEECIFCFSSTKTLDILPKNCFFLRIAYFRLYGFLTFCLSVCRYVCMCVVLHSVTDTPFNLELFDFGIIFLVCKN